MILYTTWILYTIIALIIGSFIQSSSAQFNISHRHLTAVIFSIQPLRVMLPVKFAKIGFHKSRTSTQSLACITLKFVFSCLRWNYKTFERYRWYIMTFFYFFYLYIYIYNPKIHKYIPVTKNINGIISMYFRENVFVTFV